MGLFGGSRPNLMAGAAYENARNTAFQAGAPTESAALFMDQPTEGLTRAQKLQLLGATMRDAGAGFGGQQGTAIDGATSGFEAEAAARFKAQQAQALQALGKGLFGGDARAQLLMRMNPKALSDALAKGYEPQQVSAGNTLLNGPGGAPFMAPKLVEDQGIYGTQGAGGYQQTGARAPSIAERQTQFKNAADIDAEIQRLQIAKGQLAVQQGQLGINRDAYNARLRGVGGFGTPGVGGGGLGGGDVPTGAGWEVQ